MSGVFSIAAHSVLQYFPDVTLQEQTGWAHFLLSSNAIWYLLLLNQPQDWMCASKERRHANLSILLSAKLARHIKLLAR
jgi:hypothetical protein